MGQIYDIILITFTSFPSEIRRDLSPYGGFPFEDPGGIGMGVQPFLGPLDEVEDRLVIGLRSNKVLHFFFLTQLMALRLSE